MKYLAKKQFLNTYEMALFADEQNPFLKNTQVWVFKLVGFFYNLLILIFLITN